MNFLEAIKSGKPLRIKDSPRYCGSNGDGYVCPEYALSNLVTVKEVLSDQWEIQQQIVTISESQFDVAFEIASNAPSVSKIKKVLKKELGFL